MGGSGLVLFEFVPACINAQRMESSDFLPLEEVNCFLKLLSRFLCAPETLKFVPLVNIESED